MEDTLPYDEPPAWHWPTRQVLGAALLAAGKPAEAEAAYRDELKRNPENGWSLHGLEKSLRAQQRETEADEIADWLADPCAKLSTNLPDKLSISPMVLVWKP